MSEQDNSKCADCKYYFNGCVKEVCERDDGLAYKVERLFKIYLLTVILTIGLMVWFIFYCRIRVFFVP